MKRRITLSIALVLSVVTLSLTSSDSAVKAQNQMRVVADTGTVALGPGQVLRVSVDGELGGGLYGELGGGTYGVRFRQVIYGQETCGAGGVCKHTIVSQDTTPRITVAEDEGVWIDIDKTSNSTGARVIVLSSRRDVTVQGIVFDTATQRVVTAIQMSMQRENQ